MENNTIILTLLIVTTILGFSVIDQQAHALQIHWMQTIVVKQWVEWVENRVKLHQIQILVRLPIRI